MRRRARGPARQETVQKGVAVVGDGDGVDVDAVAPEPIERPMRRRRGRRCRESRPKPHPGEIGHAGRAVVDDGQAAGAQMKVAQCGKTGVGRSKNVDARGPADGVERCARSRIVERVMRKGPAGERGGVAVHDADPQSADLRHQVHRQRSQSCRRAGQGVGGAAQIGQDLVRAPHHVLADRRRIGAAAAGADVVRRARSRSPHCRGSHGGAPRVARPRRTNSAPRRTSGSRR